MAEFIKGLNEGANKTSKKDIAYMAGLQIGHTLYERYQPGTVRCDFTKTISKDNFMARFRRRH